MPSSSRRKQSKPQHLANEVGDSEPAGNQHITSSHCSAGDQTTQEVNFTADDSGQTSDDRDSGTPNDLDSVDYHQHKRKLLIQDEDSQNFTDSDGIDCEPNDLSGKVKVFYQYDLDPPDIDEEHQDDLQQSADGTFKCKECGVSFNSKDSLEQHQIMIHPEPVNNISNIAQQNSPPHRKRSHYDLDRTHMSIMEGNPSHLDTDSSHLTEGAEDSMSSKHLRLDNQMTSLQYHNSAIPPHLEAIYDMRAARLGDERGSFGHGEGLDGKGPLTQACPVCSKQFPKASDLKRHMMCHTGEKPFRCQYCQKPFRAKSSMHYHLKATHGVEIELSPGLEERYLRMKTRAQMNLLSRGGHLSGLSQMYGSESTNFNRDNIDFEDTEDESKSNDSLYQNSGIGSDGSSSAAKSQGQLHGQTGNYDKFALDLSMAGKEKTYHRDSQVKVGDVILYGNDSVKKSKLSVQNESVLVTRIVGMDLSSGENTSVYKCYLCTQTFPSPSKMQYHLSLHFDKQFSTYQCCFCSEIFHSKTHMQTHLRRKHKLEVSGLHVTENGTKDFRSSKFSIQGQLSHTNHRSCRFCHKSFDNEISLQKHTRLHLWNRNCYCRSCGKSFNQYTSLQLHISRVHCKTENKSNHSSSWIRNKMNFFRAPKRMRPLNHILQSKNFEMEPLNLVRGQSNGRDSFLPGDSVTMVIPRSPVDNGNESDQALSQHSSDNNWSESLSDSPQYDGDDIGGEIMSAPKKYLLPSKHDTSPKSSHHNSWKTHQPPHLVFQNSIASAAVNNDVPLNFAKSDSGIHDSNNNDSQSSSSSLIQNYRSRSPPDLSNSMMPTSMANPEALLPGYSLNATSHLLMAKALLAHQTLTHHFNNTSQPMIFPPNHLPPSLAAMSQMMSLPVPNQILGDPHAGTSKSPSPASHSSSKSEASPEEREHVSELPGMGRMRYNMDKTGSLWNFNMYSPDTGHTDGRKVTSLSRTHSRLGIVQSPINRESLCKPTALPDGRTIYKCPFCAKEFVSYSDINRHMDFHEDIRPYKCQFCDYFARTNSQLKVHMMRHQGIREFCCKLCNYKGVTQSDLNRHMKSQIHMLKSRNACTYCGEGFVTSKNLEKHLDGNCIVKMQKLNGGLDLPLQERVA